MEVELSLSGALFAGTLLGATPEELYYDIQESVRIQSECYAMFGCKDRPYYCLPDGIIEDMYGRRSGGKSHEWRESSILLPILDHPVKSLADAENYQLPPRGEWTNFERRKKFAGYVGGKVSIPAGTPFTMLLSIAGPELILRWMSRRRKTIEHLLAQIERYIIECADEIIKTFGIENCTAGFGMVLETGDLVPHRIVQELSMPAMHRVKTYLDKAGITSWSVHLCGNQNNNLELVRELGLPEGSFISCDEKTDMIRAIRTFGSSHTYSGNIPTHLLVSGQPEEVFGYSVGLMTHLEPYIDSFVLAPSCDMPPNARPENVQAMSEAVKYWKDRQK